MVASAWSWSELAAATLARQFPRIDAAGGPDAVVDLLRRVGPIQSQAARAPFLCVASRLPGASYDAICAAHELLQVVRSTSLRGTVHTSTREQHAALAAVAGHAQSGFWRRALTLDQEQLDGFRAELERLTTDGWRSNAELAAAMVDWLRERGLSDALSAVTTSQTGRYSYRGHAAMLRRPVAGSWEGQGAVLFRSARCAVDEERVDVPDALVLLTRAHLAASGPASRRDIAWWSGAGLRQVDAAVATLGEQLVRRRGPNGLEYLDLADAPAVGDDDCGVRLLPEYDALLLAYEPAARDRFADAAAVAHTWNRANGVHSPTVLAGGRLRACWRLERAAGRRVASIAVEMLPGERPLDPGDLTDAAAAIGTALALTVTDVTIGSAGDARRSIS